MIYALVIFIVIVLLTYNSILVKNYKYNVKKNYQYNFDQSNASICEVTLENALIKLPLVKANHALFLKVKVNNNIISRWFESRVSVSLQDCRTTTCTVSNGFEHAAEGVRYLNISSLFTSLTEDKQDVVLNIRVKNVTIKPQTMQLISMENKPLHDANILILSPHPDDAEIAGFGLYKTYKQAHIVTITGGDSGVHKNTTLFKNKASHFFKKGKIRTWNSLTVPLLAGIPYQNILNLGFFDSRLKEMYHNPDKIFTSIETHDADIEQFRKQNTSPLAKNIKGESNWKSLVQNLEYLIEEINPDIIVAPYPQIDSHHDHKFTSIALFEALQNLKRQSGSLFLYSNHHPLSNHYPYGQATSTITLPPSEENTTALYFNSIYSHPLSIDTQQDKFISLEAMYDLRIDTKWLSIGGSIRNLLQANKRKFAGDKTYFRRAVRSNELFFVVDTKNINNIYNGK